VVDVENGLESTMGEDSDSVGNSKAGKTSVTPPAKEKKKPFFKKVSIFTLPSGGISL